MEKFHKKKPRLYGSVQFRSLSKLAIGTLNIKHFKIAFCLLTTTIFAQKITEAQQYDCNFKPPVITIDFGSANNKKAVDLLSLKNYSYVNDRCPGDGQYSFASRTEGCFGNNWNILAEDHTPNDINGRMMVINASEEPGTFFLNYISGLKQGATYEFSAWLMNICWGNNGCTPTSPQIIISLSSGTNLIASFETGALPPSHEVKWKRYYGMFTVPPGAIVVAIKMDNIVEGGCGSDFVVDDILIKECTMQMPVVVAPTAAETTGNTKHNPPGRNNNKTRPTTTVLKKNNAVIVNAPLENKPATAPGVEMQKFSTMPIPTIIATRDNPLIKHIETAESELLIELYDNGEIDGDTVTIYHNNQLLVSQAGISAKPVTVKIKVDKEHPHHELIMVADNLGLIPPNTSLMVLTTNNKRYEVFISSSEQKNAKIVIDLKEP